MTLEESQARRKTAGRNDPCPCGSGKKYKKCHYAEDEAAVHEDLAKQRTLAEAAAEALANDENHKAAAGASAGHRPKQPHAAAKQQGARTAAPTARAANLPRRGAV